MPKTRIHRRPLISAETLWIASHVLIAFAAVMLLMTAITFLYLVDHSNLRRTLYLGIGSLSIGLLTGLIGDKVARR